MIIRLKGGHGSGDYGHSGRPGRVGGSSSHSYEYPLVKQRSDVPWDKVEIAGKTGAEWARRSDAISATKHAKLMKQLEHYKNLDPDSVEKYVTRLDEHRRMVLEETIKISQHYYLERDEQEDLMYNLIYHDSYDKYDDNVAVPYIETYTTNHYGNAFWKACNNHHDDNPHHPEFWAKSHDRANQMPTVNFIEMLGDWIATAKWKNAPIDEYYRKNGDEYVLHPMTRAAAERELGIEETPFPDLFPRDFHFKEYHEGKLPQWGIDAVLLDDSDKLHKEWMEMKGGSGSGNFGHAGRKGKVGGSAPAKNANTPADLGDKREFVKRASKNVFDQMNINRQTSSRENLEKLRNDVNFMTGVLESLRDPKTERILDRGLRNMVGEKDPDIDVTWEDVNTYVRGTVKDGIVVKLAAKTKLDEETVNQLIAQWAKSSNGDDMRSLSLHQAATEEFDTELSEWQKASIAKLESTDPDIRARAARTELDDFIRGKGIKDIDEFNAFMRNKDNRDKAVEMMMEWYKIAEASGNKTPFTSAFEKMGVMQPGSSKYTSYTSRSTERKFLRAMYESTQADMKKNGYGPEDEITLYRGFNLDGNKPSVDQVGDTIRYRGNAMESWSVSPRVAKNFGNIVIGMKVKVKNVLSTARTGFGCLTEGEVVVLGNNDVNATLVGFVEGSSWDD